MNSPQICKHMGGVILKNTEGNDEINLIASIPYLKEEKELFDVTFF